MINLFYHEGFKAGEVITQYLKYIHNNIFYKLLFFYKDLLLHM